VQEELLDSVMATGKPTVLVLLNGRPFAIPDVVGKTAAILEAWFPGQEGAAVIVETLFGDVNPGGKSTLTFSQGAGVQPLYYNHTYLGPGIPRLPEASPVFPFGHGLSYTQFTYQNLSISAAEIRLDGEVRISCEVTNSGDRSGEEVVQLYLHDEVASISRPVKELKGFKRIALQPRQVKKITFVVAADMLAFTGLHYRKVIEPGQVAVMIGSSSEDIRLKGQFNLMGQVREPGEDRVLSVPVEVRTI
jgi:beta-glucosidase